ATDPGNPRGYIDGQVYGVRLFLEDSLSVPITYPFNQWDFVSLLVWTQFAADEPPSWLGSLQPIFQQYANLYPVMETFVDLGDYESVCSVRELLLLAMNAEAGNPNTMPVTRDLSRSKREAIVRWLTSVGSDGKPLLGPAPVVTPKSDASTAVDDGGPPTPETPRGGKTLAASRRVKLLARFREV